MQTQSEPFRGNTSQTPSGSSGPDFGWIFNRMKNMIMNPNGTWPEVKNEAATVKDIYLKWYIFIAAIVPLSTIVSFYTQPSPMSQLPPEAMDNPFLQSMAGALTPSLGRTINTAIGTYVIALAMLFVMSKVLQFLATKFGGNPDTPSAMKLMAYGQSPQAAAGLISWLPVPVLPALATIGLSLYSIYVYWVGITPMLGVPEAKRLVFTIVAVITMIILSMILSMFLLPIFIFM